MGTCKSISVKDTISINKHRETWIDGKIKNSSKVSTISSQQDAQNINIQRMVHQVGGEKKDTYSLEVLSDIEMGKSINQDESLSQDGDIRKENHQFIFDENRRRIMENKAQERDQVRRKNYLLSFNDIIYKVPELQEVVNSSICIRRSQMHRLWNSEKHIEPQLKGPTYLRMNNRIQSLALIHHIRPIQELPLNRNNLIGDESKYQYEGSKS